jgi:hypothetical protein
VQITIPVRGKQIRVDTDKPTFETELLTTGVAFVVRHNQSVLLAVAEEGRTTVFFEMPVELFHMFRIEEQVYETPNGKQVTAEKVEAVPQQPPRPTTPEQAAHYIANWKANGWKKPDGDLYRLRGSNKPDAADRVTATLKRPKDTATRAAKAARN